MTLRETILLFPGLAECKSYIDKVLTDRSIIGADSYSVDMKVVANLVAADLYLMVGGLPDFTESGISKAYPRTWYNETARRLYRENGEPEKAETIGKQIIIPRGKAPQSW